MRVLLVEDDELVADAVRRGLTASGLSVHHAASAEAATGALVAERFDLAILDIGLPGADGLTLLKRLRAQGSDVPVLVLTAHYALHEKMRAFDMGADDFLMKPFEQAELGARCRALLRRANQVPSGTLRIGRLQIDLIGHQLQIDGVVVDLTRREWLVLENLTHHVGRIVTKERLLQVFAGWDQDLSANAVETYVSRLRSKLGDAAHIRTVRGLGYRLEGGGSGECG